MMAFFLAGNKKYSWTGFFAALLIGFSRIYLCVHYPSDVLFGFIVGIIAGSIAYLIVWLLYKYLKGTKLGDILYDKDIITLYNFIKNKYFNKKQPALVDSQNDSSNLDKDIINSTEITDQTRAEEENKNIESTIVDTQNISDK